MKRNDGESFVVEQVIHKGVAVEAIADWLEGHMKKVD